MITYETGATTRAANDLVLCLLNRAEAQNDLRHIALATMQGSTHRGLTFREMAQQEVIIQRQMGSKFKPSEITEAGKIIGARVFADVIQDMVDRVDTTRAVQCSYRRWWDDVNGNSYFSCCVSLPLFGGGWTMFVIPFQYGYGSQPEQETRQVLARIGLGDCAIDFNDQGYMQKKKLYDRVSIKGLDY